MYKNNWYVRDTHNKKTLRSDIIKIRNPHILTLQFLFFLLTLFLLWQLSTTKKAHCFCLLWGIDILTYLNSTIQFNYGPHSMEWENSFYYVNNPNAVYFNPYLYIKRKLYDRSYVTYKLTPPPKKKKIKIQKSTLS